MNKGQVSRGFTIVEVIAAALLLGVGIAAAMGALTGLARTEIRLGESEKVSRLAVMKMDEVLAVGNLTNAATEGTFEDINEPDYSWTLEVTPTGIENLDSVRITVKRDNGPTNLPQGEASSLSFTSPNAAAQGATN